MKQGLEDKPVWSHTSHILHRTQAARDLAMRACKKRHDDIAARRRGADLCPVPREESPGNIRASEGPALADWYKHLKKHDLGFLCPRPPLPTDRDKGTRTGATGNRRGLATKCRAKWEATTHDIWTLQDGTAASLRRLGPGQMVHCRYCDYHNGSPDGRGDCSAHTTVRGRSLGVWCWGCQAQFFLDLTLPRVIGTKDPILRELPAGTYLTDVEPAIDLLSETRKFVAIDAPTGAGKTHMLKK